MGLKLDYTDDTKGIVLTDTHDVIQWVQVFPNLTVKIKTQKYISKAAMDAGKKPIGAIIHDCPEADFETYFGETVLGAADTTILTAAYAYLLTIPYYASAVVE